MEPLRIDYHVHTNYSYDCRSSLPDILKRAEEQGLDAICITDHDTLDAQEELPQLPVSPVQVLMGCEFTVEDGSHIIGIGLHEMIYEREPFSLMRRIKEQDGLVLLPHLFRVGSGILRDELCRSRAFIDAVLAEADMVELFNGRDSYEHNLRSRELIIARGLPCVAGSDAHQVEEVGSVFVAYDAEMFVKHGVSPRRFYYPPQEPPPQGVLIGTVLSHCRTAYRMLPLPLRKSIYQVRHARKRSMPPPVAQHSINSGGYR